MPTVGKQVHISTSTWTEIGITVYDGDGLNLLVTQGGAGPCSFGYQGGTAPGRFFAQPGGVIPPNYPHSGGGTFATFGDLPFDYVVTGDTDNGIRPWCLAFALKSSAPTLPYALGFCPGVARKYTAAEVATLVDGVGPWNLYALFNDTDGGSDYANNNGFWEVLARVPERIGDQNHTGVGFKWARAFDDEDRRRGGYCAETGFWAPEHCLVNTPHGRIIDYFAPEER